VSKPFDFSSKHVVITGGATGIGHALLHLLAETGSPHVTVLDLKHPAGPHDTFIETDLSDPAAIDAAVAQVNGPVNVLFNNAGVAATQSTEVVMAVNYLAPRRLTESLLPQIPTGGAIVNTASIAGNLWANHLQEINELLDIDGWEVSLEWIRSHSGSDRVIEDSYGFSKEVVRVWGMRHSRRTIKSGVRMNSVCPAPVDTPLLKDFTTTMGAEVIRWTISQGTGIIMSAREVAMPLAFLGSDASTYVNGHDLIVDGGFTASLNTDQLDFDSFGAS
jgi:NAD(P)-dependent dehydrogenase (short-subunit alcohol dehydrogenase family)